MMNNKRLAIVLLIGSSMIFCSTFAFAETIVFKSGQVVNTKIIEKTDKYIKVEAGNSGTVLSYPLEQIESIGEKSAFSGQYSPQVAVTDDNNAEKYFKEGIHYYNQSNLDQAITAWSKAIKIKPNYAEAYCNRGVAYREKGKLGLAFVDYNKAIKIAPNYAEAYYNRGSAYGDQGKFVQGISDYSKAIEIKPNLSEAYVDRAFLYAKMGNLDQAIDDCSKAIKLKPNNAELYIHRVNLYAVKKQYDKAWKDVYKARSLGKEVDPELIKELEGVSGRSQ